MKYRFQVAITVEAETSAAACALVEDVLHCGSSYDIEGEERNLDITWAFAGGEEMEG